MGSPHFGYDGVRRGNSLPEDKFRSIRIRIEDWEDLKEYAKYNNMTLSKSFHSILSKHFKKPDRRII